MYSVFFLFLCELLIATFLNCVFWVILFSFACAHSTLSVSFVHFHLYRVVGNIFAEKKISNNSGTPRYQISPKNLAVLLLNAGKLSYRNLQFFFSSRQTTTVNAWNRESFKINVSYRVHNLLIDNEYFFHILCCYSNSFKAYTSKNEVEKHFANVFLISSAISFWKYW